MKKLIALLLCILFAVSISSVALANDTESASDDEIIYRYSNVNDVATNFSISSAGKASVKNS